mgnify:CR=1 FL=1
MCFVLHIRIYYSMKKPTYIKFPEHIYFYLKQRGLELQRQGKPFTLVAQLSEMVEQEREREEAVCSSEH